ncbi:MAG: DUF6259 domain-containing protein [bacterium]|nr:DUF6259 domain-containing protein [bacterium]
MKIIQPNTLLWRVVIRNIAGKEIAFTNLDAQFNKKRNCYHKNKLTKKSGRNNIRKHSFTWVYQIAKSESVKIQVYLRRKNSGSAIHYTSIKFTLPKSWFVVRTEFPIISDIYLGNRMKLAVPCGWGLEYDLSNPETIEKYRKTGLVYQSVYPYCQAVMQFIAFYSNGKGLYLGAHDRTATMKEFKVIPKNNGTFEFRLTTFAGVDFNTIQARYTLPFEFAIATFTGDYYAAAQFYREFSYTTPWGKKSAISKRHTADWLKQTDLWLRPMGSAETNLAITQQALDYFGVQTALHWYRWHRIPYDTLYPEYFPALPDFADGVKKMQNVGSYVMPYINGRLWDPASDSWKNEKVKEKTAALNEKQEVYIEVYGSKVPLAVMCPYTQNWKRKVKELVKRLINEINVDGVYIDQIGAAPAVQCYNQSHGHPVGGGDFWYLGYRDMLESIRKTLPKSKIITTEENIECWIDQFDAMLVVNTQTDERKIIPLFPAVYSDRIILFGFMYYPADDLERGIPFRAKIAQCFIFGSQPGWVQPDKIMNPKYRNEAELLRNIVRCRRFAHNFVNYGKFLGLIEVKGDNPRVLGIGTGSFGGTYPIDIPAVIASGWRAKNGSVGILIANHSDNDHTVSLDLPLEKEKITDKKRIHLYIFGSEGFESLRVIKSNRCSLTVPCRSAKLLDITVLKTV